VLNLRKVVAYELLSLAGVAEKPDGFFADWDDAMDANLAAVIAAQDSVILGRRSYEEWAEFWPDSDVEPFATFINGEAKAGVERPETDDPRADLEAFLREMTNEIFGSKSCFVVGFVTALRNDPELARVFRESLLTEMRDQIRRPIARVLGDDDPDLGLRVDLAPALLIFRTLIGDRPVDPDDLARRLCALVLGPVAPPLR
jgi:Tetracyclin repressor-like, C-terminal domain